MTGFSWPRSDSIHRERKNSTNSEMLPALSVKIGPSGMGRGFKCVVIWCLPPISVERSDSLWLRRPRNGQCPLWKGDGAISGNKSLMIQCLFSKERTALKQKVFFIYDLWITKLEYEQKTEKSYPSFIKLFYCLITCFCLAAMTERGKYGRRQHKFPQMQTLCSLHCSHSTINYFHLECLAALVSAAVLALLHLLQNQLHGTYV